MPKKKIKKTTATVEQTVMRQITAGRIAMKPRWYFVAGSVAMSLGMVGVSIFAIFLFNLSFFLLRQHGPMGEWRLKTMVESFPWYIPVLAVLSAGAGVMLLKKYDISYKYNFKILIFGFIIALCVAAALIDASGINDTWLRQGQMKRLYRQNNLQNGGGQREQRNYQFIRE